MKKLALLFSIIVLASGTCLAQTSGFTYQGKLGNAGAPANGTYQFECKLFDIEQDLPLQSSIQIGATQTVVASVQNGNFTMRLDFGAASFAAGQNRWLEIGVRLNGSNDVYTVFSPRQQINSVPFAVRSLNATTADNATSLNGVAAGNYVQTSDTRLSDARMPTAGSANYIQNTTAQTSGDFNISGTGAANVLNATQYKIGGNRVMSNGGFASLYAGVDAGATSTGEFNSFFGASSGKSNTGSCCNSFFGSDSGYLNSGANNSFFGSGAGLNNQGGSSNTFVGSNAGSSGTSGTGNIAIGYNSGWSNTGENYNTFIGYQANAAGGSGITNATALGNQAVVTRSNSVVLGSINGVGSGIADTNVGIGTTAPLFRFHVKTGTDQDVVVRSGADFSGSLTGIGLQSINDANTAYQPLDLEGSKITMNVGSGGSVGIGTTAPTFKLQIVDAANTGLRVQTNAAGGTVASFGGNGVFQIDAPGTAGGRLKITENGKVSIPAPSGLVLRSPNNSCWAINVSDAGALSTSSVPCP